MCSDITIIVNSIRYLLNKKENQIFLNKKEFRRIKSKGIQKKYKNYFLKIIDNALIDKRSHKKLEKFIENWVSIYL